MHVAITGGTGYIGRHVVRSLVARGDTCSVVSRSAVNPWSDHRVRMVVGDPKTPGPWQDAVAQADAVVNLAGAPLVAPPARWTDRRKRALYESRVATTTNVTAAIQGAASPPAVHLSGSAIGYYGPRGDDVVTEAEPAGRDFLGRMCADWERAALDVGGPTRVVTLRTGLVVGERAPFLVPMLPFFRLGLGASWGDGQEWVSWIHIADEVGLVLRALDDAALSGALNLTAPHPIRVDAFARALAGAVRRPLWLRIPEWAMRLALGEQGDALFNLQRVVPDKALQAGYAFQFPEIGGALRASV